MLLSVCVARSIRETQPQPQDHRKKERNQVIDWEKVGKNHSSTLLEGGSGVPDPEKGSQEGDTDQIV